MNFSNHRAAWRGSDLAKDQASWQYRFSKAENDEIRKVAEGIVATRSPAEWRDLKPSDVPLPTLQRQLAQWSDQLEEGRGFVLLRGLDVANWPMNVIQVVYLILGCHLGVFVSQNSDGDLLGHIRDDGSDPSDPSVRLYRTREPQPFHVDGSDAVALLCLKPAKSGGKSSIVSSVSIYNEIVRRKPHLEKCMHELYYYDSYGQHRAGEDPWFTLPIFAGTSESFRFMYIRWYIDKCQQNPAAPRLRPEQVELLDLIDQLAASDSLRLDMDFQPGDIQLLSNRVILHAREGYEDFPEPERKRHLLRLWLTLHRNTVDGKGDVGFEKREDGIKGDKAAIALDKPHSKM